jgi:hypothetical protein
MVDIHRAGVTVSPDTRDHDRRPTDPAARAAARAAAKAEAAAETTAAKAEAAKAAAETKLAAKTAAKAKAASAAAPKLAAAAAAKAKAQWRDKRPAPKAAATRPNAAAETDAAFQAQAAPPLPKIPEELTRWRVPAAVQALRTAQEIAALHDRTSPHAHDATDCLARAIRVIERSQTSSWTTKLARAIDGSSVENAWQHLKTAEEDLALAKDADELRSDVPWLCDVARLSYPASTADKTCATLNSWTGSTGKQPDAQLAADILKADHDQSNLAHQQTRSLRNLLYVVTAVVVVLVYIAWLLNLGSASVIALGALGGTLAMVFVISKGTPVVPYNLAVPQLLLKVAAGSAVAVAAVMILNASFQAGLTSAEKEMYALIFGFSQQLFTNLVDNRAATLNEALAPKASKTMSGG